VRFMTKKMSLVRELIKLKRGIMEDLIAKSLNLIDLVDYAKGAVVSKQIIKEEKGNVTLFAFDQGEGLSEHTAPFNALVYIVDGVSEVIIEGNSHNLSKGQMIIMPANKPHALKAIERFKMLLVMIRA